VKFGETLSELSDLEPEGLLSQIGTGESRVPRRDRPFGPGSGSSSESRNHPDPRWTYRFRNERMEFHPYYTGGETEPESALATMLNHLTWETAAGQTLASELAGGEHPEEDDLPAREAAALGMFHQVVADSGGRIYLHGETGHGKRAAYGRLGEGKSRQLLV
jgi:hypothetical protein